MTAAPNEDDTYTPERHLLTPGQRRHSPQRHTAAGTAAPTTTDTGNTTVPQRADPTQSEVDAPGVITFTRGCFERCCSNKKSSPYHSNRRGYPEVPRGGPTGSLGEKKIEVGGVQDTET